MREQWETRGGVAALQRFGGAVPLTSVVTSGGCCCGIAPYPYCAFCAGGCCMYPWRDCRSSPASACGRFAWFWIHASLPTFSAPAATAQSHSQPVSDSGDDGLAEVEGLLANTWCNVPPCCRDRDDQRQGQWEAHVPPPLPPPGCCHATQAGLRPLPRWKLQNVRAGQIRRLRLALAQCTIKGRRHMNLSPSAPQAQKPCSFSPRGPFKKETLHAQTAAPSSKQCGEGEASE
jgi:hypothetical protein